MQEPEGVNYLASVSDLMAGLLFIFIVILMVTLINSQRINTNLQAKQREFDDVRERLVATESRLYGNAEARTRMLERLESRIREQLGLRLIADPSLGVLRIPEDAVSFASGSDALNIDNKSKLRRMGEILEREIACYSPGSTDFKSSRCTGANPHGNTLEAVFIEGHTDNQRYADDPLDSRNRELSTKRSNSVYREMVSPNPALASMMNSKGQALFSLSGYGAERPLEGHRHVRPTNDPANRRIEVRFLFAEPEFEDEERSLLHRSVASGGNVRG